MANRHEKNKRTARLVVRVVVGVAMSVMLVSLLSAALGGFRRASIRQSSVVASEAVAQIGSQHRLWKLESMKQQRPRQRHEQHSLQQQQQQQQQQTNRRHMPGGGGGGGAFERAWDAIFSTEPVEVEASGAGTGAGEAGSLLSLVEEPEYLERLTEAYLRLVNVLSSRNRGARPLVAIASTISSSRVGLAVEVLPWIAYHAYLGAFLAARSRRRRLPAAG